VIVAPPTDSTVAEQGAKPMSTISDHQVTTPPTAAVPPAVTASPPAAGGTAAPAAPRVRIGELVYRFTGQLATPYPVGLFADGIRFHNRFEGTVVDGPFAGGSISGLDKFLLRPDGAGEIVAPEVIDDGESRVALDVHGYLVPPAGTPQLPLAAVLEPGFEFPDLDFRVTGAATIATTAPAHVHLNAAVAVIEGTVNMATGAMDVSAYRAVPSS
jgi:hypothetical protein